MLSEGEFVRNMKLTPQEVNVLDRYVSIIEQAHKNRIDFVNADVVAFTPGALLVVAVADFAYQLYKDYGSVALTPEQLQVHFKDIARQLAELESAGEVGASVDTYVKFRRDLMAAKRQT